MYMCMVILLFMYCSQEYEERQYGATWWIRTKLVVIGQLVDHVTEGLELLKRYMDGFNDQGIF